MLSVVLISMVVKYSSALYFSGELIVQLQQYLEGARAEQHPKEPPR